MKNLKIYVIILNVLFVLAVLTSCGSIKNQTSLEYHQELQKELSWSNYNSKKNRIKRAKDRVKAIEDQEKLRREEEKLRARIAKIEGKGNE